MPGCPNTQRNFGRSAGIAETRCQKPGWSVRTVQAVRRPELKDAHSARNTPPPRAGVKPPAKRARRGAGSSALPNSYIAATLKSILSTGQRSQCTPGPRSARQAAAIPRCPSPSPLPRHVGRGARGRRRDGQQAAGRVKGTFSSTGSRPGPPAGAHARKRKTDVGRRHAPRPAPISFLVTSIPPPAPVALL